MPDAFTAAKQSGDSPTFWTRVARTIDAIKILGGYRPGGGFAGQGQRRNTTMTETSNTSGTFTES